MAEPAMIAPVAVDIEVVWRRVSTDPSLAEVLDDRERERAARRGNPARYTTAHALLRTAVAEQVGGTPQAVVFERTCATCGSHRHGKPTVAGHPELSVSLSYAGGLAVVALSRGGEVGVDVEVVDDSDFEGFNAVTLDPSEVPALDRLGPDRLGVARARVWARKEAVLKASGHGLAVDPRQVVVSGPEEPAALLRWKGDVPLGTGVQLADVPLTEPGHVAAVALLSDRPAQVRLVSA
ncbi:4'-phosphopantetheinyl transferase superfamily protein [Phycicoccus sp. SLBN-51]|uniref:4'-phosphopantetheinyl transferase family protein n=1 Tax=Phycicoccus sp. SLBN-51 TaxID=2768447 RepID=UPI00114DF10D|nr:4'-phosphopantetheinyl transferase superfamily protein [Phycicoccus sp. SLBN-51]TQJ51488.1 4'-phosphopantetheinyl transferase [Phycicoccus sp. SLBN-51]